MKKDKGVIIFFAVMFSFISLIISFFYTIISEEESTPTPGQAPRSTRIPIGPTAPTGPTGPTGQPSTLLSKPTLDNGKINWQGSDQTGVDYDGLVWNGVGDAPWDQKYKFRCEKNGTVSEFSDVYGPVSYFNYNNPKIRVSLDGVKPCAGDSDSKLQVFDSTTDTDITSQMKSFDMLSPYDGYESIFADNRTAPLSKPTFMNGKINWQGSNQTDVEGGGLVWNGVGNAPWNKNYKFRCEKNGTVSDFSDVYGPVSYNNYKNPKIRVSLDGEKPCAGDSDSKLQVFDSTTDTDITSQMRSFDILSPYDGYESIFADNRA
jgi:hypothetical protein